MTEGQKYSTFNTVALCVISIMVISVLYIRMIHYMSSVSYLNGLEFDNENVTASDYTVEMDITEDMWASFLENQWQ